MVRAFTKQICRKQLAQKQRPDILKIASAYCTMSKPVILVITSIMLVALLTGECKQYKPLHEEGKQEDRNEPICLIAGDGGRKDNNGL